MHIRIQQQSSNSHPLPDSTFANWLDLNTNNNSSVHLGHYLSKTDLEESRHSSSSHAAKDRSTTQLGLAPSGPTAMESDLLTDLPPGPGQQGPKAIIEPSLEHNPQQLQLQQQQTSEQSSRSGRATSSAGIGAGAGPGAGPGPGSGPEQAGPSSPSSAPWPATLTTRFQDHLKLFFSMHHKLFDLVAFYVVMFALNGQITSLPTRLEWIGFCVQSIVALRRAFQTSIKHGLGLTSFLGMLDLLVGQLFLHQDRLGFLPTVANILVYFYVINLTRGLVFGDSVSCLLWFLFGLVDIYRRDLSSASILDLTPYKVIPVHTVGFGLYVLMSELVDVMLHSAEPDQIQGRYLNYVGAQKEGPVSFRSTSRRATNQSTDNSNLRFELCITEITPFTVSFCLNALSETPVTEQSSAQDSSSKSSIPTAPTTTISDEGSIGGPRIANDTIDLSTIKVGSIANSFSNSSSTPRQQPNPAITPTPRIISTSDIVIHVNYIPWRQVQYHFPDEQSFTLFGLTPATDYEIEMKVHRFSSFIARVGTRAAPRTPIPPTTGFEKPAKPIDPAPKNPKNRKSKRNQKAQRENNSSGAGVGGDGGSGKSKTVSTSVSSALPTLATAASDALASLSQTRPSDTSSSSPSSTSLLSEKSATGPLVEQKSANQLLLEQLQASIQTSVDTAAITRATIKKLKRDQSKSEALLRQELEGIGRGQAKAALQDQKRRQKLSFLQESIKQANAHTVTLQEELVEVRESTTGTQRDLEDMVDVIRTLELDVQAAQSTLKTEIAPLKVESQQLQAEIKRLEGYRLDWVTQTSQLQDSEIAPLQLRLQRLEQQQIVWKVAAKANKDKDHEATLKVAALEEVVQKKNLKIQEFNTTLQELKDSNVQLKEAVEKEMETWESLEREVDLSHDLGDDEDDHPPLTFSQDQLLSSTSSSFLASHPSSSTRPTSTHAPLHHHLGGQHHLDMTMDPIYGDSFWFSSANGITAATTTATLGSSSSTLAAADLWQTSSSSSAINKPLPLPSSPLPRLQCDDSHASASRSGI
ncbi:hypothetical protein BGZ95_007043 [Linnemannia exigua]|uniref:Uncharacterized protein n=1 Tax=Linnemannia exigua TaxID=604196 RepID=A0AAD4DFY0_9FUNG|nr:hypothetical protein BGZ95_007043 [Linnemannia exigua]